MPQSSPRPARAARAARAPRLCLAACLTLAACASTAPDDAAEPRTRRFEFDYQVVVADLQPGQRAQVWIPAARSDAWQDAELIGLSAPGAVQLGHEPVHGNRMLHVAADADAEGRLELEARWRIERREVLPGLGSPAGQGERERLLGSDQLVPVGDARFVELLAESGDRTPRGLYDFVLGHVDYAKPAGGDWGRGDALWVCDSRHGNCTDFHSLFIGLSRTAGIPAQFEMGFPLPTDAREGEIGGYHCWAWFLGADGHWLPVDISEADKHPERAESYYGALPPDRVSFSVGRDLVLQPPQAGPPLNFLVYPYVELDGSPHRDVSTRFSFRDID